LETLLNLVSRAVLERSIILTDYRSILMQAVGTLDPNTKESRADLYARARDMLERQLQEKDRLPATTEMSVFETAIKDIEAEIAHREAMALGNRQNRRQTPPSNIKSTTRGDGTLAKKSLSRSIIATVGAVALGVICIGGIAYYTGQSATTSRNQSSPVIRAGNQPTVRAGEEILDVEDPVPGIDGGSTTDGLPYPLRRQAIFYRTVHQVGTIIIDRSQRFLYLVQPKIVALRYGIAVGGECFHDGGCTVSPEGNTGPNGSLRRH
jgi:hypothetical protein